MVFGMFVFGLGVSPLSVTQEAIIVRFFRSHGLGVSMAFGLVAGKGASFVAARTSYPLTERFGPHAPFYLATGLAAFSVVMNVVYISVSRWLVENTGAELEAGELASAARKTADAGDLSEARAIEEVAKKHRVELNDFLKLGDVFWAYVFPPYLHVVYMLTTAQVHRPQLLLWHNMVTFSSSSCVSYSNPTHIYWLI
jgi:MFS family permease